MTGDIRTARPPAALAGPRRYVKPVVTVHAFGAVIQSGTGPKLEGASGMQQKLTPGGDPTSDDA